jgi:peptidylamidoglycolate lyase
MFACSMALWLFVASCEHNTPAKGSMTGECAADASAPKATTLGFRGTPTRETSRRPFVVHGWPMHPPGEALGEATGVAVDEHDHVFVFHRAERIFDYPPPLEPISQNTVVVFDGSTGEQVAAWGSGRFSLPHGLAVDGENNVWVTDVGLHQVFKLSHEGEVLKTYGIAGEPGKDADHFFLPTDVAILDDGSFYVADGYENTRIVRFSAEGIFVDAWGTPGKGAGEFDLPHSIAWDGAHTLYVADRGNRRIQVFTLEGKHQGTWSEAALGRPFGISVAASGEVVVIDGGDLPATGPDRSRVLILSPSGEILQTLGEFGSQDGQFRMGHDVAVGEAGAIYVVDIGGKRVQKFLGALTTESDFDVNLSR